MYIVALYLQCLSAVPVLSLHFVLFYITCLFVCSCCCSHRNFPLGSITLISSYPQKYNHMKSQNETRSHLVLDIHLKILHHLKLEFGVQRYVTSSY